MNHPQTKPPASAGETAAGWERRLRAQPELLPQVAQRLDIIELKHTDTATADQAETAGRAVVRHIGQVSLTGWAERRQQQVLTQARTQTPALEHHAQKNSLGTPPLVPSRCRWCCWALGGGIGTG